MKITVVGAEILERVVDFRVLSCWRKRHHHELDGSRLPDGALAAVSKSRPRGILTLRIASWTQSGEERTTVGDDSATPWCESEGSVDQPPLDPQTWSGPFLDHLEEFEAEIPRKVRRASTGALAATVRQIPDR